MNMPEFLEQARAILGTSMNEDAGSEGTAYLLAYKGTLKEEGLKIENKEDGKAKIVFDFPHDYGFAMETLKNLGAEIISLELLY